MHNIKLIIAYDGRRYLGWQKTRMGLSIEETLQKTIEQILQHPAHLQAASRTDVGVHARGQVVNFLTSKPQLDLNKLVISLNSLLPKDITVLQADFMPVSFHPTLDCLGKEYHYFVCFGPMQLPHHRLYSWHVHHFLDLDLMKKAISHLIGVHMFTAFCNVKKNAHYSDFIREVKNLDMIRLEENRLLFKITGNHFLYKMARNLVGTVVDIGRGKIPLEALPHILNSKQRILAGVTAPAHGLFLYQVIYG